MSRDAQRFTKTYSYYRVQPRMEVQYIVDDSLDWKNSVRAASTGNVPLTGSTPLSVDGITIESGNRVLLNSQSSGSQNGIYVCTITNSSYSLARSLDANSETLSCGAATYVEEGSTNGGKIYIMSTTGAITVDTTSLTWTEFSGGGGGVGGSGTSGYVAKFTGTSTIGNSTILDDGTNVGIGTNSYTSRLFVSGSSTSSTPAMIVKGGVASPTSNAGLFEVQNSSGTSIFFVTGTLGTIGGRVGVGTNRPSALFHVSGTYAGSSHGMQIGAPNVFGVATNTYTSLQHTFFGGDGTSKRFVIDSNGNVILGGELPGLTANTTRLLVTGSSTLTNGTLVVKAGVPSPTGPLLDIQDYAGNSIVFVSGSGLSGSLTKLTDGTSYLRAGTNITISTGSNGAVTIEASGGSGPTGSGTDGYLAQWSGGTTVLGDSFVRNFNSDIAKYMKKEHWFEDSAGGSYVYIKSNSTDTGRIGINVNPSFALDIIAGANSINEAVRVRNNNGGQGTGLRQTFIAGNYSEPTFRITHAWPSNAEGHYTFFGITNPTPSAGTPSIAERLKLYSSGSVEVSGSFVARLDPEIINKPVLSAQKANGTEVMWVSSSAGTNTVGTDVFMWVSGSRTTDNTGADKVVFGGDVRISGSLSVGTGSVLLTSNDVQFGSSGMRIQKSGSDMKFFDINNSGGLTLSELAAGGGGSSPTYWTSSTNGQVYATGSVGIGTTSPADRLSVHNGGQDRVGANISSAVSSLYMGSNINAEGVTSIEYDRSAGKLHFKYGSTGSPLSTAVSIKTADGNVGIGNTSPTTKLFVESASGVQIEATNGTVGQRVGYCLSGVGYSGTSTNHPYSLLVNDSEKMRIDTSGNVGVGTSAASAKLHVFGTDGETATIIRGGTTAPANAKPVLQVTGYDNSTVLWVSGSSTHGARVGIGTTNPRAAVMLDVGSKGSTGTNNYVNVEASSTGECGYSWTNGGANPLWKFSRAASTSNISLIEQGSSNVALLCEYSTGYVGIGTNDPSEKLHVNSGNIKVDTAGYGVRLSDSPTNADAQTLDAYYEKDLVVTLKSQNNNLSCSLYVASRTLKFTRIGRMVTISGYLQVETVTSTGTGRLYIDLGTASGERPSSMSAVALYINQPDAAVDWNNPVIAYADSGTSRIYIDRYDAGQGFSNGLTLSQFVEVDQEFMVSVSYSTN